MTTISLGDLLSDSLDRFQPIADQKDIALKAKISPDVDPISANATKLTRVLDNLLSNAVRYSPPEGEIRIGAKRLSVGVQVTVEDQGPGFNEQDIPRLFEQFYRGEQARSRATGGAGLGLAIARSIVQAHDGRIWAENISSGGARIGFVIP